MSDKKIHRDRLDSDRAWCGIYVNGQTVTSDWNGTTCSNCFRSYGAKISDNKITPKRRQPMNKYAIHVPHYLLSEAVQKKLFDMGYGWYGEHGDQTHTDHSQELDSCLNKNNPNHCIILDSGDEEKTIDCEIKDNLPDYTILTVDEFFAVEEEREEEEVVIGDTVISATETHVIMTSIKTSNSLVIPWKEFDKILALKPETTP